VVDGFACTVSGVAGQQEDEAGDEACAPASAFSGLVEPGVYVFGGSNYPIPCAVLCPFYPVTYRMRVLKIL
jgi:hypothetical protein